MTIVTASVALFVSTLDALLFIYLTYKFIIKEVSEKLAFACNQSDVLSEALPLAWPAPKLCAPVYPYAWIVLSFIELACNAVAVYFSWEIAFDDPTFDDNDSLVVAFMIGIAFQCLYIVLRFFWARYLFNSNMVYVAALAFLLAFYNAMVFCWILWWTALLQFVTAAVALYALYFSAFVYFSIIEQPTPPPTAEPLETHFTPVVSSKE